MSDTRVKSDAGVQTTYQMLIAPAYHSDGHNAVQQMGLTHAEQRAPSAVEGAVARTQPEYNVKPVSGKLAIELGISLIITAPCPWS